MKTLIIRAAIVAGGLALAGLAAIQPAVSLLLLLLSALSVLRSPVLRGLRPRRLGVLVMVILL
jgi:hypothetical protein